jgi:hypothetical protein
LRCSGYWVGSAAVGRIKDILNRIEAKVNDPSKHAVGLQLKKGRTRKRVYKTRHWAHADISDHVESIYN